MIEQLFCPCNEMVGCFNDEQSRNNLPIKHERICLKDCIYEKNKIYTCPTRKDGALPRRTHLCNHC